ncbi:ribosome biogenesis protein Nop53/GLTSCR2 [Cokeromyces recurvatus]|uniref:ribosome biogenesis protein Nop53/GLTSCR2 n=1 Tax=Cokeromyces recurvatus TaxID=90255 RepID=UPI002220B069|nr:ribosome biogenesis protein Nop53/GLTSCR2 [Cokeromyces recurvatus]KAI7898649.1 ribosome biogenesis protein Nop53/GLTSCR2 [Cokeromyces recurvatus]
MASDIAQIQKKKTQPSRKGKKAWRKNVDITDVEEAQEELRSIERVIGHTEELKDEELFTIDVAGDHHVKRKLAKDKPLRVDEILAQRSAVPAIKSKNAFQKPEMTDDVFSKHESKLLKRKIENNAPLVPKKKNKKTLNVKSYDLWDDEPKREEAANDFLPIEEKIKAPKTMLKKPSALEHVPAIHTPEGGQSYNPTLEDHQRLLAKAVEVEERKAEILKKLQEQLSYREELKLLADELAHSEITADGKIVTTEAVEEEEEEESDKEENDESRERKKKKKGERKTRQERHKSHRLATEELQKKQRLQERAIRRQIHMLRDIEKELSERIEELNEIAEKRGERKIEEEKKGLKKIGKYTVPELPVDVQLTDELCETLRQLKVNFI